MSMKVTAKDKRMLSFISAAGIFLLSVFLVLIPLYQANLEIRQQYEKNKASVWERELKIAQLPIMKSVYEEKKAELAGILEPLYPILRSQDIDRILQREVMINGLSAIKLQIGMPKEPSDIAAYGQNVRAAGSNPDQSEDGFYMAVVTLEVSGQMIDMYRLIDTIACNMPGIRIASLYWSSDRKGDNMLELNLQMIMSKHK